MKKALTVIGLAALFVLTGATTHGVVVDFPWKTFEEARPFVISMNMGTCPRGTAIEGTIVKDNVTWRYWVADTGHMVMALWQAGNEGAPNAVGFGRLDAAAPDTIPSLRWEVYNPDVHTGPCDDLFPLSEKL